MIPLVATVVAIVFLTTLWVPVLRRSYESNMARHAEQFLFTKLRLVRKYYPQLHELTYTEILEQYDVDALYDNIGRELYHREPRHMAMMITALRYGRSTPT